MYAFFIFLHGLLRWVVIGTALWAIVRPKDKRPSLAFVASLDTQVLLGLVLYLFLSPITHAALAAMGEAMKNKELRFWAVEHAFSMILALVFAHVGRVRMRRAKDPELAARRMRLWVILALVAVVVGNPWPGLPYGRPLFPHF
jgi:hypothetical protein